VNPANGVLAPAASAALSLGFDATGLAPGVYTGNLCVHSDDPDMGPGNGTDFVVVPVTLTVSMPLTPSLALTKTVGTVPGVCAATSNIAVPTGTTVYYCYTVTNTGDVPFTTHDLVDDQLGTIFNGAAYLLNPGETVNTVTLGVTASAVLNAPTVNVATWTAHDGAGAPTTATSTAFVDVYGFSCLYPQENFEAGVPPVGWSVINNVMGGPTWGDLAACGQAGNYTGSTGNAACMSPGTLVEQPFDAELRTPVFDLVGYSDATISFLLNFQAYAGIDRLTLDISTDAGGTWSNLQTWTTDQGAFQNTPGVFPTIDLGAYAGMSNLMLRWHYYYPGGNGLGWYAQIDEPHLKCTAAPPTAVTLAGISAVPAQSLPAGLPLAALPTVVTFALGAAYAVRRKQ
ncbi:MAG: choice-of-anchor J domain-containing protein, partial [Anaerolineae bacterium]